MGNRGKGSGAGESWLSRGSRRPDVHTAQRRQGSGITVVPRTGLSAARTVCGTSFTHTIEGGGWVMRKLIAVIAVSLLIGGLLAGAGPASAATFNYLPGQGGMADPLTLASSGVLLPYNSGVSPTGIAALIEVASPINDHNNLHMIFFNEDCAKTGPSIPAPVTENGVVFIDPVDAGITPPKRGLVAISKLYPGDSFFTPLWGGIHARLYQFDPASGRSQVFEPIMLDTFEFNSSRDGVNGRNNGIRGLGTLIWSPLRTGITFFAPPETATVQTLLNFICPRNTIQNSLTNSPSGVFGGVDATTSQGVPQYTNTGAQGFPVIWPPFSAGKTTLTGFVFIHGGEDDEVSFRDLSFDCDCLTANVTLDGATGLSHGSVYGAAALAGGSYTELRTQETGAAPQACNPNTDSRNCDFSGDSNPKSSRIGSFTGWRSSFTVGSPLNNFFTRFSDGSGDSIFGGNQYNER